MPSEQVFGSIGAVLIMLGVFLPILSLPIWGSINLWQIQQSLAFILLLVAALHLLCCIRRLWWVLYFTKAGMLITLGLLAYRNWHRIMGPSDPLMGLVKQVVKVHWGVGVLAAGLIVTLASATPRRSPAVRAKGVAVRQPATDSETR